MPRKSEKKSVVAVELEKAEENPFQHTPESSPEVPEFFAGIKTQGQLELEQREREVRERIIQERREQQKSSEKFMRTLQIIALGTIGVGLGIVAVKYFYKPDLKDAEIIARAAAEQL